MPSWSDLAGGRRPNALDAICLSALTAYGAYRLATLLFVPSLVGTHPVLLEALRGSTAAMVAAGAFVRVGRAEIWVAVAAGVFGLAGFDPMIWLAGRRYGRRLAAFYGRRSPWQARVIERSERAFRRWGAWSVVLAYYMPVPNNLIYAAAGETGMPLWRFVALDLAGTLLHVVVVVGLGYAIGQRAVTVATAVSRYALISTLALVVLVAAVSFGREQWSRRGVGGARVVPTPSAPEPIDPAGAQPPRD